jgi:hypothetical protein
LNRSNAREKSDSSRVHAHLLEGVGETGPARVLAEDDLAALLADRGGVHDLVGVAGPQHAVLVDTRLMGEGVAAHDRLVVLHRVAGEARHQPGGLEDLGGVGPDLDPEDVLAGLDRHDDLLDRGVAGPLADPVDGPFDLAGPAEIAESELATARPRSS